MQRPEKYPYEYVGDPVIKDGISYQQFKSVTHHNDKQIPVVGVKGTRIEKAPPPVSEDTPLYHGTASWHPHKSDKDNPLKEGDLILPGSDANVPKTYSYNGIENYAHATPHVGIALRYARNKNLWQRGPMYPSDGYSRVYQVSPVDMDDLTPDPNHMEEGKSLKAVRSSKGFKVVRQLDPSEFPNLSGQFFKKGDEWSDEHTQ